MPVTQRCNYAGTLGKPVPTRSFSAARAGAMKAMMGTLAARLRGLAALPRRPH